ncbi:hypothetical protein HK098_007728 [Nowakowskiella sp. JEL0407]|nr:hypothetical protein HK098_007728 [Nowakowskiella sp. JEL0407]
MNSLPPEIIERISTYLPKSRNRYANAFLLFSLSCKYYYDILLPRSFARISARARGSLSNFNSFCNKHPVFYSQLKRRMKKLDMYIGEVDVPNDISQFEMLEELVCEVSPSVSSGVNSGQFPPFIRAIGTTLSFLKILDLKIQITAEILTALGEAFSSLSLLEKLCAQLYGCLDMRLGNDEIISFTDAAKIMGGRFSNLRNLRSLVLNDFHLTYWHNAVMEPLIPSLNALPRLESVSLRNCSMPDLYCLPQLNHLKKLDIILDGISNTLVASAIRQCVSLIELNVSSDTITPQSAVIAFFNGLNNGKLPKITTFLLEECSNESIVDIPLDSRSVEAFSFFMNDGFQTLFGNICIHLTASPNLKRFAAFDVKSGCDEYIELVIATSPTLEEIRLMQLNNESLINGIAASRTLKRFTLEDYLRFVDETGLILGRNVVLEEIVLGLNENGCDIQDLYNLVRSVRSNTQSRIKRIMLRNTNEDAKWVDITEDLSEVWLQFTDSFLTLHVVEDYDSFALAVLKKWVDGELDCINRIALSKTSDRNIQEILGSTWYQNLMEREMIAFGFIDGDHCIYLI